MKEKLKLIGIIAIVAIAGFAVTACGGDPCEEGHDWDTWDPTTDPSERKCKNCEEVDKCYCDDPNNFSDWVQVGTTAASTRNCNTCGKLQNLSKEHFYGKWVGLTLNNNKQTIELDANKFTVYLTSADSYTITNAAWAIEVNSNASKNLYPVGFGITGTSATVGDNFKQNGENTSAGVYINADGTKIVLRLTTTFSNNNGVIREYVYTKE